MKKITKYDVVLIASIAIINCVFLILGGRRLAGYGRNQVGIYVDGEKREEYVIGPGYEDQFTEYTDYGFNTISTENGYVWIDDADCDDKLCVLQGKISGSGQVIICLPHRLVVRIEGSGERDLDAVSQ